jgi:structural maintenance of chromosome 2
MYVKQITLEGFKSYASRVCVDGFDPQFNAITGLNGSGKSKMMVLCGGQTGGREACSSFVQ